MSRPDHGNGSAIDDAAHPMRIDDAAVKAAGLAVSWIGGVLCGWRVFHQSNLLEAVLRGAATWLALIVLWLMALAFCRRFVLRPSVAAAASDRREPAPGRVPGEAEP